MNYIFRYFQVLSPMSFNPNTVQIEYHNGLMISLLKWLASKRKLLWFSLISKTSVIISGANSFFNLIFSAASVWRFLWCIATESSSSNRSLNDRLLLSWYTSLKALWCSLIIRLFCSLLRKLKQNCSAYMLQMFSLDFYVSLDPYSLLFLWQHVIVGAWFLSR